MAEVVGTEGLWREVIKVCAVDFLSGETLLNTLVLPTAKVRRWKTEITGVTDRMMAEARSTGQALQGWTEARSQLWQCIDASTVLVGQALHNDLEVLGMLHARIVDSAILAAKGVDIPSAKPYGLKKMCKEIFNLDIQCTNGGMHDCLEDVLASREIVLHFVYNSDRLQTWTLRKRKEELKRRSAIASGEKDGIVRNDWDDDDEILRWEDIAEDLGWPHPDTGYDPWSD